MNKADENSFLTSSHTALSVAVFIAYLAPEWLAFFSHDVNVFVNGWDEETYLSWQGINGSRDQFGYFILYINWLLQYYGISGATQNLLYDSILPPAITYIVYLTAKRNGIPHGRALGYATLICYSSVLFNYANPLVKLILGPYEAKVLFAAGWELYPSILRTPNPQLSYLLIASTVYAYHRFRKLWLIIVPLPFLYFHVAIPYILLFSSALIYSRFDARYFSNKILAVLVSVTFAFLCLGIGLSFVSMLAGLYEPDHPYRMNSLLFVETRQPQIPLALVLFTFIGMLAVIHKPEYIHFPLFPSLLFLSLTALASVNFHILTGFMLVQKNYYDYGISMIVGVIIIMMIELFLETSSRGPILTILLAILVFMVFYTQLPWYRSAASISAKLSTTINKIRQDPLHAVIPDLDVSSKVAYSTARLLAPPFSYQYYFSFIESQCVGYRSLLERAQAFVEESPMLTTDERTRLSRTTENIVNARPRLTPLSQNSFSYCREFDTADSEFYLAPRQ